MGADIILPVFVLAELLLYPKVHPRMNLLCNQIMIGLEPGGVMQEISTRTPSQILSYCPFLRRNSVEREAYEELCANPLEPSPDVLAWAQSVKRKNLEFGSTLVAASREARSRIGGVRFASLEEVLSHQVASTTSFLGEIILSRFRTQNQILDTELEARIMACVLRNPFLRGHFLTVLCFLISFTRLWSHNLKHLNFDPSPDRDDWTDMTLALYAGPGDVILSADTKFRDIIELVWNDQVRVLPCSELYVV